MWIPEIGKTKDFYYRKVLLKGFDGLETTVWIQCDVQIAVSELEGTAPPRYVKELVMELEQQLLAFRRQMDVADKQMQASPKLLTEQGKEQ